MEAPNGRGSSIDNWFLDRGVPHLIVGYSAAEDIFTRMFRFLSLVMFVELFLTFSDDLGGWGQAGAFGLGLVALLAAFAL